MNRNVVVTDNWSNEGSRSRYQSRWTEEPDVLRKYEDGEQCGGCSFFAPFNADWGLCCHPWSRHRLETVFEHFTCPDHVNEGWGSHSFKETPEPSDDG